ncbi:hypothetical protein Q7P37_009813 [Cladosporium fusiforme]
MQFTVRVTDDSAEVSRQQRCHSERIGSFTPAAVIDEILAFSQDAKLPQFYFDYEDDYWYEMLEKEGLQEKVRDIANAWSEEVTNVTCAANQVGRPTTQVGRSLVKASGFCRFKPTSDQSSWSLHKRPGTDEQQQIMVFLALDDLGPHNGFPFALSRGQHVSMDGHTSLLTPPTGGGRAICFSLRL